MSDTPPRMSDPIPLRVSRSSDGTIIWLWRNGSTWTFDPVSWDELRRLISDFTSTGARSMQNFPDLPTRTPLHTNTPTTKSSLEDLI